MSQIPGLNPVDSARAHTTSGPPPVVTVDTLIRLLGKLAELERRIALLERR